MDHSEIFLCLSWEWGNNLLKLHKFAQIPCWWSHTKRGNNFWTSRPRFLDSTLNFTSEVVQPYFLRQECWSKVKPSFMCFFSTKALHSTSLAPKKSSKSCLSQSYGLFTIAGSKKYQYAINCQKSKYWYYWMQGFLLISYLAPLYSRVIKIPLKMESTNMNKCQRFIKFQPNREHYFCSR